MNEFQSDFQQRLLLFYPSDIRRDCLVMVISVMDIRSYLCSIWFYKMSSFCKKTGFAFMSSAELSFTALSNFC